MWRTRIKWARSLGRRRERPDVDGEEYGRVSPTRSASIAARASLSSMQRARSRAAKAATIREGAVVGSDTLKEYIRKARKDAASAPSYDAVDHLRRPSEPQLRPAHVEPFAGNPPQFQNAPCDRCASASATSSSRHVEGHCKLGATPTWPLFFLNWRCPERSRASSAVSAVLALVVTGPRLDAQRLADPRSRREALALYRTGVRWRISRSECAIRPGVHQRGRQDFFHAWCMIRPASCNISRI